MLGTILTNDLVLGYYRYPSPPSLVRVGGLLDTDEEYDFELPKYYMDRLINDICSSIGITIRDEMLHAASENNESQEIQKQNI